MQEVETYVYRHQKIVPQFIATSPIMDLCLEVDRRTGSRVTNWWWKQSGLDVEGMQTADWEVEWMKGEDETDITEGGIDYVGERIIQHT